MARFVTETRGGGIGPALGVEGMTPGECNPPAGYALKVLWDCGSKHLKKPRRWTRGAQGVLCLVNWYESQAMHATTAPTTPAQPKRTPLNMLRGVGTRGVG